MAAEGNEPPRDAGTTSGSPLAAGAGTSPVAPAATAGQENGTPPQVVSDASGATAVPSNDRAADSEHLRRPEPVPPPLSGSGQTGGTGTSNPEPPGQPIASPVTPPGPPTDQEKTRRMAALREPAKHEVLTESRKNPVEAAAHGSLPKTLREQGAAAHFALSQDLFNRLTEGCVADDMEVGERRICIVHCMCPAVAFATVLKKCKSEGVAILGVDLDQVADTGAGARPSGPQFMSRLSAILPAVIEKELPGERNCVVAVLLGSAGRRESCWSDLEPEAAFISLAERYRVKKLCLVAGAEHEYWSQSHKSLPVARINEFIAIKHVLSSMGLEGADERASDPIDAQARREEWGKRYEAGTQILTAIKEKEYSVLYQRSRKDIEQKDYAREWTASFTQILADSIARGSGQDPVTKALTARERLIAYFLASHFEDIPMSLFLEWSNYLCKEYAITIAAERPQDAPRVHSPSISDDTLRWCEIGTYSNDDRGVRVRFLGRDKMRDHFRKLFDENATIAKIQLFSAIVKSSPMTVDSKSVQRLAEVAADVIRLKGFQDKALQSVVAPLLYREVTAGDEIHVHFVGDVEASVDLIFGVAAALAARLGKDATELLDSLWAATIMPADVLQDQVIRSLLVDLPLAAVFARALARDDGLAITSRAMRALVDSSPNQSDLLLSTIWGEPEKRKGETRGRLISMSPKRCLELLMMAAPEIMAGRRKDVSPAWRRFCIRLFSRLLVCWIDFVNLTPDSEVTASEADAEAVFTQCGGLDKCLDVLMKAICSRKFTGYAGHLFDQEVGTPDDEEDSVEELAREEAGRFKFEMTSFILRTLLGTRAARGLEWPALSQIARSIGGVPFEIIEMNMMSQALWVRDSDERAAIRDGVTGVGFPDPFRLFDRAVGDFLKSVPIYLLFALLVRPGSSHGWTGLPRCAVDFLAQWRGERNNRDSILASHSSYRLFATNYREGLDKAYERRTDDARDKREQARKWLREARDELGRRQALWRTFREQGLTTPAHNSN